MTRFGLDVEERRHPHVEDELFYSSDEDDDEQEPPHPLGFGTCRYGLVDDSLDSDAEEENFFDRSEQRLKSVKSGTTQERSYGDDSVLTVRQLTPQKQQWPPLDSLIDARVIPTKELIRYANEPPRHDYSDEMDSLSHLLLSAASLGKWTATSPVTTTPTDSITRPYKLIHADCRQIQQEIQQVRSKLEAKSQAAAQAFAAWLRSEEAKAEQIQAEQARRDAAADAARLKEQELEIEQRKKEEEVRQQHQKEEAEKREKQRRETEAAADLERAEQAAAAKEMAYIDRAERLMAQLKQIRAAASTFESSSDATIKKRRLLMKKLVGGKVNTLAENVDKVRSVAADVSQAISTARDEDETAKQQLAAGNNAYTREMGRGKRYLLDLLCSKVMVRVQSEGFNGQRGDGFPLANMLALVSVSQKDIVPVLEAHIYTECPTGIPRLPSIDSEASEDDLMASLGMKRNADGTSETFKRFLDRTESIISLVADIMSSKPDEHTLLGGHKAAIVWLKRFLSSLPRPPASPLPLLTAPVLDAFLTGAGHMLANLHEDEFRPLLADIMTDIVHRLDEGPIGAPSATRLKKTIEVGLDGFKKTLPNKALAELYNGAPNHERTIASGMNPFQNTAVSSQHGFSGFGGQTGSNNTPFGGVTSSAQAPFNSLGNTPITSPFVSSISSGQIEPEMNDKSSAFSSALSSPFGNIQSTSSSPFASTISTPQQSAKMTSAGPFGGSISQVSTSTPFGASANGQPNGFLASSNPFGSQTMTQGQPAPFGVASNSPFGAPSSSSPFGNAPAPTPSPFGSGNSTMPFSGVSTSQSSPFGTQSATTTFGSSTASASPFGGGASSSPFGVSSGSIASPFGTSASKGTSFGTNAGSGGGSNNGTVRNKAPCKFFAKGTCRFGNNCKFSHDNPGGSSGNQGRQSGFSASSFQPSPFSNPFGGPRR